MGGRGTRARAIAAVLLALLLSVAVVSSARAAAPDLSKTSCVYSNHSISELNSFSAMVNHQVNCAMVYNDAVTTWQQWDRPWFINDRIADNDWSAWATTPGTSRQLVITEDLIPSGVEGDDWLDAGAAGAYMQYATTLAQNLVSAGLGTSVIRLAPEANGTWFADSLGTTSAQWAAWNQFWDNTVQAMRSVPGADFQFDWCISALQRNLPLSAIYPGSQYVDIIGVDVYDDGNLGATGAARWNRLMTAGDGLGAVVAFAAAQNKPISIPEWGVNTVAGGGFGDDPTFVQGIASLVAQNPTAYQSYFYKYGQQTQLAPGTQSLAAYQAAFGDGGYALVGAGSPNSSTAGMPTPPSPSSPSSVSSLPPAGGPSTSTTTTAPAGGTSSSASKSPAAPSSTGGTATMRPTAIERAQRRRARAQRASRRRRLLARRRRERARRQASRARR